MTPQHPLGSGFGPQSTAADVLAGVDLDGATVVLTGGYSGVGAAATRALAASGARVVVPSRRPDAAARELADVPAVTVVPCDLADLESVAAAGREIVSAHPRIDAFIACAAVMACPETRTPLGWELQLATNHVGHAALTTGLWPSLEGHGARAVFVSSGAHHASPMRWDDLHFASGYERWAAYGQSKTANALWAIALDAAGAADGVRAFSAHPGSILTPLQRHLTPEELVAIGWIDAEGRPVEPSLKSVDQGAATMLWAAFSPQLSGEGGVYCADADVAPEDAVAPHARDAADAERLWEWTAEVTGGAPGR